MEGSVLKFDKRKYGVDILILALSVVVAFAFIGVFYLLIKADLKSLPILIQTLFGGFTEYVLLGLGITIVCIFRKESFKSFGLKREKLLITILLSALVCLPALLREVLQSETITYFPFQGVNFTRPILASGFPVNVIGMLIIITAWGFFEGFSYVVLYDRINKLLPAKNLFLNWGAIICGIFCLLIHIALGQTYGINGITTFIIIYGMLVVYRYTGNAWGCVLIYCFYWNAI